MYWTDREVSKIDERLLREWLEAGIREGTHVDFKLETGAWSQGVAAEFLKDVTAFANAYGGTLLYGVLQPKEGRSVDDRVRGLEKPELLIRSMTHVSSSGVSPRIAGLRFHRIPLASGKEVLMVHVPPSLARPHMVTYGDQQALFIRHSETSQRMTSHELREAVLTSASSVARAESMIKSRIATVRSRYLSGRPVLVLQAVPLLTLDPQIDVRSPAVASAVVGHDRRNRSVTFFDLAINTDLQPTIHGIRGHQSTGPDSKWQVDLHRSGYTSAIMPLDERHKMPDGEEPYLIHEGYLDIIRCFGLLLNAIWDAADIDVPYALSGTLIHARGTRFLRNTSFRRFSEPFSDDLDLEWPMHSRGVTEDVTAIADEMASQLMNAYGLSR